MPSPTFSDALHHPDTFRTLSISSFFIFFCCGVFAGFAYSHTIGEGSSADSVIPPPSPSPSSPSPLPLLNQTILTTACAAACGTNSVCNQSLWTGVVQSCTACGTDYALAGGSCVSSATPSCASLAWCSSSESSRVRLVHSGLKEAAQQNRPYLNRSTLLQGTSLGAECVSYLTLGPNNPSGKGTWEVFPTTSPPLTLLHTPLYSTSLSAQYNITHSTNWTAIAHALAPAPALSPLAAINLLNLYLMGVGFTGAVKSSLTPEVFFDNPPGQTYRDYFYNNLAQTCYVQYVEAVKALVCTSETWQRSERDPTTCVAPG